MNDDASSPWSSGDRADSVRRQVVDAAAELMRGSTGAFDGALGYADRNDQSALNTYLALLTDRLPVYAHTMEDLGTRVGERSVTRNLSAAAEATIQFYTVILVAKVNVFSRPDQLLQLRRTLKAHNLGPHAGPERVAAYLARERDLGRIAADVDCEAAAQLLIGACVNYAFTALLLGDEQPPDAYIAQLIGGLRL